MTPNPALHELNVSFSLPNSNPARLELLDASGRRVLTNEVGSLGPGRHMVKLGAAREVPAGIYWIRLTQDGHALTRKAAIVN
jgi:hypothetical protein